MPPPQMNHPGAKRQMPGDRSLTVDWLSEEGARGGTEDGVGISCRCHYLCNEQHSRAGGGGGGVFCKVRKFQQQCINLTRRQQLLVYRDSSYLSISSSGWCDLHPSVVQVIQLLLLLLLSSVCR